MDHARRRPRLAVLVVVVGMLVAAGCFGGGDDAQSPRTGSAGGPATDAGDGLAWADCKEAKLSDFQCATLDVPLDHDQPAGATVPIALARKVATGKKSARLGSLVVNPGGPGASGVDLAVSLSASLDADLLARFDLVGFDPRGVGRSDPVRCIDNLDAVIALDGDPDTAAEVQALVDERAKVAATCASRHGDVLAHLTTIETARDLDDIRAALGDAKLTYLGFSYGTQLGASYATLFPDNVRALVLDGAVAPGLSPHDQSLVQATGFEHAFENFVEACRTDRTCAAYPDAAAAFRSAQARAEAGPLPVKTNGETRTVTAGVFQTAVAGALYDQALWGFLARGLVEAGNGEGTTLLGLADLYTERKPDGTFTNLSDAFRAISCADQVERTSVDEAGALAPSFAADAPRFGPAAAWSLSSCAGWAAAAGQPLAVHATNATPVLVIGTTGDPATPYQWAGQLAAALGPAPLLTWEGEGHTAYPKTECVTKAVNEFLLEGKRPADGTRCPRETGGGSPFAAIADEFRDALAAAGLPGDAAACVARKVADVVQPADLAAASSGELPAELQSQILSFATDCARGK